jgi:two-component system, chemotaxis family, chemotaxis protein CheY|tara:strand:+ start:23314 stop:23823 length:510 start_codon:yes stop_codon:yes gene_type:complete
MTHDAFETCIARTRILVVDDNAALRGVLRVSLQAFGCAKVIETGTVDQALELLRSQPVDLVITDWKMKPRDGLDLVTSIRSPVTSPCPHLPVIMLTAYADNNRIRAARSAGVNAFLVKPVTAAALAACLRDVLTGDHGLVETDTYIGPERRNEDRPALADPDNRQTASR